MRGFASNFSLWFVELEQTNLLESYHCRCCGIKALEVRRRHVRLEGCSIVIKFVEKDKSWALRIDTYVELPAAWLSYATGKHFRAARA
jgi:hypothetical protein